MNTEQQAKQLRLAADIIETGHPWETSHNKERWWLATSADDPGIHVVNNQHIRIILATPPDGRPLHNPDNLTAEQVEAGWRLFLLGEYTNKCVDQQEKWKDGKWVHSGAIFSKTITGKHTTYRVPLSVPWPEVPKSDPYAELKAAHAAGKAIEYRDAGTQWLWQLCTKPGWFSDAEYRIKTEEPAFQLPPPPPGMRWHREDGWKEGDLPQGKRPLVLGENLDIKEDEWKIKDSTWAKRLSGDGESIQDGRTYAPHRTRRPLTFQHVGHTWTWYRPGDPMPCDGDELIEIVCSAGRTEQRDGIKYLPRRAQYNIWENTLGWRYANEKKTVPLGPDDIRCGDELDIDGARCAVLSISGHNVTFYNLGPRHLSFACLMESKARVRRRDSNTWEPCSKEVAA